MVRYSPEEKEVLREVEGEQGPSSPILEYGRPVCFVSRSRGRDKKTGKRRLRKHWKEVNLFKFRSGKSVQITDVPRGILDRLAEEIFDRDKIPPDKTPYQHWLDELGKL